ncbi:uncharacterized protein LOC100367933 [Saccoglossus kowalevskii]|uniref:Uncharacterized protein LOC100367933 n=1 Tax=Saccoglossus kowalevskii TaxID=10224 RepID=A0ABM0MLC9_SACKO|nr:PREDICTED: uncharacterized protein LOC100367933 [Saccoglossus kowalevskii]
MTGQSKHARAVLHILDDFLFVDRDFYYCKKDLDDFFSLGNELGVTLAKEKTEESATVLCFVGIELNTVLMQASLQLEKKMQRCVFQVQQFLGCKKATLKEIQSLVETLNFACTVVTLGRAFLRCLIDLTLGLTQPHHHRRINHCTKLELLLWHDFLLHFNGKAFFIISQLSEDLASQLITDAAVSTDFGALFGSHWFYGS